MSGREKASLEEAYGVQGRSRDVGVRSDAAGRGGEMDGLVPRSMRYIFQRLTSLPSDITMRVRASFYEIYNEFVYDLLAQSQSHPLPVSVVNTHTRKQRNATKCLNILLKMPLPFALPR